MAIIIDKDEDGNSIYQSAKGLGGSKEEQDNAIELDLLIKKKMDELSDSLEKSNLIFKKSARSKVEAYWNLGRALKEIYDKSGLVDPNELKLFWINARMHAPEGLLAKDRGPNRLHVGYCFRLAGYPKEMALRREWSEWVYLFDSPFVNNEHRFDEWDKRKIGEEAEYTNRESTRLFIQCLNSALRNIETGDLEESELIRCYEGSWLLTKKIFENQKFSVSGKFKQKVRSIIQESKNLIGLLIVGEVSPEKFAEQISNEIR